VDSLGLLLEGFATALTPENLLWALLWALLGVVLGTFVGVLPGIGPAMTIALLLPVMFTLEPVNAFIMFAGIYYGGMYGGSTTSILLNTPGESASIITALEGNAMARRGRAPQALATAAIGSLRRRHARHRRAGAARSGHRRLRAVLRPRRLLRAHPRRLHHGLGCARRIVRPWTVGPGAGAGDRPGRHRQPDRPGALHPRRPAAARRGRHRGRRRRAVRGGRGAVGGQPDAARRRRRHPRRQKRLSKHSEEFGSGAIEGVAGPEAANNASAAGTLVPLLALGLPTSATAAILLAAFQQYGLQPGPLLFETSPELVWGSIASLFIGSAMLLVLNLPLAPLWARLLHIPRPQLYAGIVLFASLGVFSVNGSALDLVILYVVGLLGFAMRRFGWPVAPAVIGVILGPLAEQQLRRALAISQGDVSALVDSPRAVVLPVTARPPTRGRAFS
jgi:putative tricarboxylic transport membrane protein